jgi:hypothetical protein
MSGEIASLFANIGANTGEFEAGLGRVKGGLNGLTSLLKAVPFVAVFAMAVTAAAKYETSVAQLDAAIRSTTRAAVAEAEAHGKVATVVQASRSSMLGLADSLAKVTRYSREDVISVEAMELTFTNIGANIFPQVTEAALDMSTALNQGTKQSMIQLGKALNDPIRGMTALRRVGIMFTDSQAAMIIRLAKTGQLLKAQKLILAEVTREFGGSARAAGATLAGQLDILNNSIDTLMASMGMALLPTINSFVGLLVSVVQGMGEWDPVFVQVAAAAGVLMLALSPLAATIAAILVPIGAIVIGVAALKKAWDDNFLGLRSGVENAISTVAPLLKNLADIAQKAWDTIFPKQQSEQSDGMLGRNIKVDKSNILGRLAELGGSLPKLIDDLNKLGPAGDLAALGIGAFAIALGGQLAGVAWAALTTSIMTLAGAIWALLVPLAPIALGLALIAAYLSNFGGFKDGIDKFGAGLKTALGDTIDGIVKSAKLLLELLDKISQMSPGQLLKGFGDGVSSGSIFDPRGKPGTKPAPKGGVTTPFGVVSPDQLNNGVMGGAGKGAGRRLPGQAGPNLGTNGPAGNDDPLGLKSAIMASVQAAVQWMQSVGTPQLTAAIGGALIEGIAALKTQSPEILNTIQQAMEAANAWLTGSGKPATIAVFKALGIAAGQQLAGVGGPMVDSVVAALLKIAGVFDQLPFGVGQGIANGIRGALSGARASGGPVSGSGLYLVGERGPELFSPGQSGTITPNGALTGLGGGGGNGGTNFYGNITVTGVQDPEGFFDKMKAVAKRRNLPVLTAMGG